MTRTALSAAAFCLIAGLAGAQENVVQAKASFIFNGERIKISRDLKEASFYAARFAGLEGACGVDCVAPMTVAPGVETLGEGEVLAFLTQEVAGNTGLMVDARHPDARAIGFIPGTVNLPFETLSPTNDYRGDILMALGARQFDGIYNFADARSLLVYDAGPSTDDAGRLVRNLLAAGYPAAKIKYYRGGMQVWSVLGFSIQDGTS
ncbi:MAG: rhodanese-like domain-containing protein [Pseudomonadota bacterium]